MGELTGGEVSLPTAGAETDHANLLAGMGLRSQKVDRALRSVVDAGGKLVAKGTPAQIADMMEQWYVQEAADGFNVMPPTLPSGLDDFVALVIPELQRRGLFRTDYTGRTLRDHLGLPRPASRYDRRTTEAAE